MPPADAPFRDWNVPQRSPKASRGANHTNRYDLKITASTVQRVRATLRRALNAAAAHSYLTDNPARMLKLPSARRTRPVTWSQPRVEAWLRDSTRPKIAGN